MLLKQTKHAITRKDKERERYSKAIMYLRIYVKKKNSIYLFFLSLKKIKNRIVK